jgi:hypothetical protein
MNPLLSIRINRFGLGFGGGALALIHPVLAAPLHPRQKPAILFTNRPFKSILF